MLSTDAEEPGGLGLVPARVSKGDSGPLRGGVVMPGSQDIPECGDEVRGEVVDLDRLFRQGMQYRVPAHRFELTNVSRPRSGKEAVANLLREHRARLEPELGCLLLEKDIREGKDLVLPLGQTGKLEDKKAEPIAQVPPEEARLDQVFEVGVGRGDEPDVDEPSAHLAHSADHAIIQQVKKDLLHLGRCERQLIQEERPAVCALEKADTIAVGSGEGTPCMAGEVRDLEVLGDGGARFLDEVARALGERVYVSRHHALPRAPRTENQQWVAHPGIPDAVGDYLLDGARGAKHQPELLSHSECLDSGSPTGGSIIRLQGNSGRVALELQPILKSRGDDGQMLR